MKLAFRPSASGLRVTRTFKKYAQHTHMMYMGTVSTHQLARGFTASRQHTDTDHCIGEFLHHDFTLIHRETPFGRVVIAEVDLQTSHAYSHFFIIPNSLSTQWFGRILALYPHHRYAPYAPGDAFLPVFKDKYSILSIPTYFSRSLYFADSNVAKTISTIESELYIYEVIDRSLLVYNLSAEAPTLQSLDTQMRLACTIATALEVK